MNPSKVPHEIIEKWLHSTTENGQSVIEFLINIKEFKCNFYPSDFKKFDPSVTSRYRVAEALNEYFIKNDYPFEAHCNPYEAYVERTKSLFCKFHNLFLKTESDLNEHRECLRKYPFKSTIEREVRQYEPIEKEDRETIEIREKRKEEERKVKEGLLK